MKKFNGCLALISETVHDHRDWILRCEHLKARELITIRDELAIANSDSVKVIKISLDLLGMYYGRHGTIGIIDNDAEGWPHIDRSAAYRYWHLKFAAAVALLQSRPAYLKKFNPANALFQEAAILPSLICYTIIHGLDSVRDELWRTFQKVLGTRATVTGHYWAPGREGRYELFAFRMFAATEWGRGIELPAEHRDYPLGPYATLLDAWERSEDLVKPLYEICQYHCHNLFAISPGLLPPFESPPFDLVPYEILAIYKLREQQGLETPEIDHPLMKLPTASRAPRRVHAIDDPIFAELEALFKKHCQPFWNETLGL